MNVCQPSLSRPAQRPIALAPVSVREGRVGAFETKVAVVTAKASNSPK